MIDIFDILGPIMVGPSSSHTAGAVRIGGMARSLLCGEPVRAEIGLHGSFAETGPGHGTDRALVAGLMGMKPDDLRIPRSFELAKKQGLEFSFHNVELKEAHPNSALLTVSDGEGRTLEMQAASTGGGRIRVDRLNGIAVNFTGAFKAYSILTSELAARFPAAGIDPARADISNWEAHTLKNWMLGSQGKRTGIYFGGTDDITYYTPRFAAESSCAIPEYSGGSAFYEGSFEEANLRADEYLSARPDYFTASPYDMYIGGEYALVQHRSASAPGDLRVVIVKDSFVLPVQAYLSTQFKYIDVLDPRYESEETVAEHIRAVQPDIVIVMLSAQSAGAYETYTDFGAAALTD